MMEDRLNDMERRLDVMEAKNDALAKKLDHAHQRIDELEEKASRGQPQPEGGFDQYDTDVIEVLEPGQTLTFSKIKTLYQSIGMRNEKKIKNRAKVLVNSSLFEKSGSRKWTYTGGSDE